MHGEQSTALHIQKKYKERIGFFRKKEAKTQTPVYISEAEEEYVTSFRFLGMEHGITHCKNQHPNQLQSAHPADIWQKLQKYLLLYHQTTEQLISSGCETHQFTLRKPLYKTFFSYVA